MYQIRMNATEKPDNHSIHNGSTTIKIVYIYHSTRFMHKRRTGEKRADQTQAECASAYCAKRYAMQ